MSESSKMEIGEALMEAIHEAFNSRDVDRIIAFFAEDGVFATARGPHPYGERYVGKAAIREFLAKRFASIPDMRRDLSGKLGQVDGFRNPFLTGATGLPLNSTKQAANTCAWSSGACGQGAWAG
jgi:SnoaL-like protein